MNVACSPTGFACILSYRHPWLKLCDVVTAHCELAEIVSIQDVIGSVLTPHPYQISPGQQDGSRAHILVVAVAIQNVKRRIPIHQLQLTRLAVEPQLDSGMTEERPAGEFVVSWISSAAIPADRKHIPRIIARQTAPRLPDAPISPVGRRTVSADQSERCCIISEDPAVKGPEVPLGCKSQVEHAVLQ